VGRRRLVRRDRRRRARCTRFVGRARPRQRDEGSAVQDDQGRHALRLRAMTSVVTPRQERLGLLVPLVTLLMVSVAKSGIVSAVARPAHEATPRRCAGPSNMPFSNARGEGFENHLAQMIARDRHASVSYMWWA